MRPAQGCVTSRYLTPPSLVLWLPNISTVHTQTHTHTRARTYTHALTDPYAVHSTLNEDKRLEFRVWHRTSFSSRWPATTFCFSLSSFHSFYSSLPHRSVLFLEPPKKPGRTPLPLFFLLGNKNKLNGKTQVFLLLLFFFSNSRHNVYQYSNLSVCLHSQVQCANIASHKLLDCLLVRHSLQLTSL